MASDETCKGPKVPEGTALSDNQGQTTDDNRASGPQIDAPAPELASIARAPSPLGGSAHFESHIEDVQDQVQHGLPEEAHVPLRPDDTAVDVSRSQVTSAPVASDFPGTHGHEPFLEGQFAEEQDLEIDVCCAC